MILKEIRNRTSLNHTRLEQSPLLLSFSQSYIDKPTYLAILHKFYGFFFPLEQKIGLFTNLTQWLGDYTERRKARLLLNDLNYLVPNGAIPALCGSLPVVETLAQAFGSLYVMEGSTLGGKLIYRVLQENLHLDVNQGASFFYGYGEDTGPRWKAFSQALQTFCEATGEDETVINTANDTFLALEQWLQTPT